MGLSNTEINLKRLLAAAPQQQNQAKLIPYVATLREQLEELAAERTSEGLPRISKATVNDYSEKIEAIASNMIAPAILNPKRQVRDNTLSITLNSSTERKMQFPRRTEEESNPSSPGLRRRLVTLSAVENRSRDTVEATESVPVKLDAVAHAHITKHRKLQEDLTDEMVGLAKQLKGSSLMMSQSLKNTEKILDSTEKAVEYSLASTGRANVQAMSVYSESFKTSCFTWLVMFVMICTFNMAVLLIRVTFVSQQKLHHLAMVAFLLRLIVPVL